MRGRPCSAALVAGALALAGCTTHHQAATGRPPATAGAPAGLAAFYGQRLAWHDCTDADGPPGADLGGLQCARVTVPLDYGDPNGRRIGIAVAAHFTTSASRIGVLAVNPGGPGVSGVAYVPALVHRLPRAVRDRFDIVGFDPRGVGRSAPVHCVDDRRLDAFLGQLPDPRTPAEVAAVVANQRAFAAGCARMSGAELPFVGTADAARDLDVIRAALGERRLSYLGKSYGTLLGAMYADMFPTRVRAFVLDGAIDPALRSASVYRQQALGFETNLRDFLTDCARRGDCPLGPDVGTATTRLDTLLAAIRTRPLPAPRAAHGPLTLGYATTGIAGALYSPAYWPLLRAALRDALGGDGSRLMAIADAYDERSRDGHYTNLVPALVAITCADGADRATVATAQRAAKRWARVAPHFGAQEAWGLVQCTQWPAPPTFRHHALHASDAPPILVVGTTRDPATPYAWARGLASQLRSGTLLGYDGDGHTAYAEGRSTCVDDAVTAYLVDLRTPRNGTLCR